MRGGSRRRPLGRKATQSASCTSCVCSDSTATRMTIPGSRGLLKFCLTRRPSAAKLNHHSIYNAAPTGFTMRAAAAWLLIATSTAFAQDPWLGKQFMPKGPHIKVMNGNREVSFYDVQLPYSVQA